MLVLVTSFLLTACVGGQRLGSNNFGWSPVAAAAGAEPGAPIMVYLSARLSGDVGDDKNRVKVQALRHNGTPENSPLWTFPKMGSGEGLEGVFGTPLVSRELGLVFISAVNGSLYAVDQATGSPVWDRLVGSGAPLVGGAALGRDQEDRWTVVVGSEDHGLYAFDAESGASLWDFPSDGKVWSTPVVRDRLVYFGSHDHNVYAVSLDDGEEVWRFTTGGVVVATPLVFPRANRDLVIIGSFDRNLYALDAGSGEKVWEFSSGNWFWAGAVASDTTIFAPSMDGKVYALDPDLDPSASGQEQAARWEHDMESAVVSSPALTALGLVVAAVDGRLELLSTDPGVRGQGQVVSKLQQIDEEIKSPLSALSLQPAATTGATPESTTLVFVDSESGKLRRFDLAPGLDLKPQWCFDARRREFVNVATCEPAE